MKNIALFDPKQKVIFEEIRPPKKEVKDMSKKELAFYKLLCEVENDPSVMNGKEMWQLS